MAKAKARPASRKFLFLLIIPLLLLAAAGLYYWQPWQTAKKSANPAVVKSVAATPELRSSVSTTLTPDQAVTIPVSVSNHAVMMLTVPQGAVTEPVKISLVPYLSGDPNNPLALRLFPENLNFKKPLTLVMDVSRTGHTFDNPSAGVYLSSEAQPEPKPSLIVRSVAAAQIITARITRGGLYSLHTDPAFQLKVAANTLKEPSVNSLTLLEVGTVLTAKAQKISPENLTRINKAIDYVLAKDTTSPIEYLVASQLKRTLAKLNASIWVEPAFAADVIADYLKSRCGEQFLTEYEYWSLAQNAQLEGYPDIEEVCRNKAKRLVREETDKLLSQADPSVLALIKQSQKCQQFQFDDSYIKKIQDKIDAAASKAAEKALEEASKKDPQSKAELEQAIDELTQAIREAQATGNVDQQTIDQMLQKNSQWAAKRAEIIINDPSSTPKEIVLAVEQAMARGLNEAEIASLVDKMKTRLKPRDPAAVAADPNATMAEVAVALKGDVAPDAATEAQLWQKLNDLRKKKAAEEAKDWGKPTPTPSPKPGELDWEFDSGVIGVAMLQGLFGLESFTEEGLNNLAGDLREQAQESLDASKALCDAVEEMKRELGTDNVPPELLQQQEKSCQDVNSGKAMDQVEEYLGEIENEADKVGDNQEQYDEDAQAEDPDHMEIEITPTDEPEGVTEIEPTPESPLGQLEIYTDESE